MKHLLSDYVWQLFEAVENAIKYSKDLPALSCAPPSLASAARAGSSVNIDKLSMIEESKKYKRYSTEN